jgi:hypothetical protein
MRPYIKTLGAQPPIKTPYSALERLDLTKQLPSRVKPCLHPSHSPVGSTCTGAQVPTLAPTVRATSKPPAMAPKRANSKAAPSVDEAAKAALQLRKRARPSPTTPTKELAKTKHTVRDSATINTHQKAPSAPAALKGSQKCHPQASLHQRVRTQQRTARSSVSPQKNSYSYGPCASKTATSRSKKKSSRPSANVSLCRPRCAK